MWHPHISRPYLDNDVEFDANLLKYYNSKDYRKEVKENAYRLYKETMLPVHAYHSIMSQISKSL